MKKREAPSRTIEWGFGIGFLPERCMQVKKGQSVRLEGNFGAHPLGPGGGDEPNPFSGLPDPVAGASVVSFPTVGVFGFECGIHATMSGAIRVVD